MSARNTYVAVLSPSHGDGGITHSALIRRPLAVAAPNNRNIPVTAILIIVLPELDMREGIEVDD
jgi:hypothetical protein